MKRTLSLALGASLAVLALAGCGGDRPGPSDDEGGSVLLRFNVDPVGRNLQLNRKLAARFEQETGIRVELVIGPQSATERLSLYLQDFGAGSPEIDVYQIDVIWPGILAEHLLDLAPAMGEEIEKFFPAIVANNTIGERLVAVPWFADAGLLYYRTDLLKKYGYVVPPSTWDELETMAKQIQRWERASGNPDFWGYVWQGRAYEGLTCNALEWVDSHGGGSIVETDGTISVNNPRAAAALNRARGWIGGISPPGVTTYDEDTSLNLFKTGQAAFLRNWPYAYSICNEEGSAIRGAFDVAVLPNGGGGHAAALGGWQLAVSKYSQHAEEAIEFVKWMTSADVQKQRALEAGLLATRPAIYDDEEIASAIPYFPRLREVLNSATARPSTVTGENYNEVSTKFFQAVHQVLTGRKSAEEALAELETTLHSILD
ncbi:ABC transporter substrate-binding protein [Candidatus Sumerlaeota bacterium]|nr:ABC transporter substrate-binding protein [Candidatus Sumerlaeota bacterium]